MSDRLRTALLLAPAVATLGALFAGGLAIAAWRSLDTPVPFGAYRAILADPGFLRSLGLSLWIAAASTALSALIALPLALMLRRRFAGRGPLHVLLNLNLTVPHVVGAFGILYLFGQSGLLARLAWHAGLITRPAEFPVLVQDPWAIGILLHYTWKEAPFIALILLARLRAMGDDQAAAARSLGASPWQAFRHVTLPQLLPSLAAAALIVFAFGFGTYEVPLLLGASSPRALPVTAWQAWADTDLAARPQAMAMGLVTAAVAGLVTAALLRLLRR